MDPITAAILLTMVVGSATAGVIQHNKAVKAGNKMRKQQEDMRVDSVRAQVGAQEQKTNLALGTAASRPNNTLSPSFASAALTGNVSAGQPNFNTNGSSGTF